MEKIWLLAGTTEGRLIAEKAGRLGLECYASTATEYGKDRLDSAAGVKAISGRMDAVSYTHLAQDISEDSEAKLKA